MEGEKVCFKYSKEVKLISCLCLAIVFPLVGFVLHQSDEMYAAYSGSRLHSIFLLIPATLCFIAFLYFPLRAPRYYISSEEGLYVKFVIGGAFYSTEKYDIVKGVSSSEIKSATRQFGSGGYFGYIGLFRVPNLGLCKFYLTSMEGEVIRITERLSGRRTYINQ